MPHKILGFPRFSTTQGGRWQLGLFIQGYKAGLWQGWQKPWLGVLKIQFISFLTLSALSMLFWPQPILAGPWIKYDMKWPASNFGFLKGHFIGRIRIPHKLVSHKLALLSHFNVMFFGAGRPLGSDDRLPVPAASKHHWIMLSSSKMPHSSPLPLICETSFPAKTWERTWRTNAFDMTV